jgi:hypothetical protein
MGPVAGLAAGLGIAALASHLGFGDELASMASSRDDQWSFLFSFCLDDQWSFLFFRWHLLGLATAWKCATLLLGLLAGVGSLSVVVGRLAVRVACRRGKGSTECAGVAAGNPLELPCHAIP